MRRSLLLATCLSLGGLSLGGLFLGSLVLPAAIGALAQAEGERQFDAAAARLRAGLGSDSTLEWRSRSIDPVTGQARLQGLTIRRGKERIAAEEATLDDLRADRVGRAVFTAVRVDSPGKDPSQTNVLTAARVTTAGLLLPALAGGPGVDWSAAAVEEAVAEGLRMEAADKSGAELGRLSVAGYAPGTVREAVLEGLRFTDTRDGETRIALGRARLAGAAVPRLGQPFDPWALAADSALLEGLEVSVEKDDVRFRLGRTQLDGWGEGRLSTLAVEGLAVEGDASGSGPFSAQLGRIAISGVAARDTAYAIANDLNPPQSSPGQDQAGTIEGIAVALDGTPVLRIAAIRGLNSWDAAAPGTELGHLGVEGMVIDLPAEYGGAWLDQLGYKQIQAALGIDTRLSRQDERLTIEPFAIDATGMGRFGLSMDVRGFDVPVPGQPVADDPMALMANWSVAGMGLRYTDLGLLRALVARQAAQERITERQLRDRYAQMAMRTPLPGAGRGKEAPGVTRIREALASFARDLGTIELNIRPPKPVAFLEAVGFAGMPPEQAVRELNLTARATPPAR